MQEESVVIYPTYEESKKRFKKAFRTLKEVTETADTIDEHTALETHVEYVKAFQEFSNAYETLVTYDDYNDDMEESPVLKEQVFNFRGTGRHL